MTERRDYVGLDWVAGEIAESLEAAQSALQSYIDDPNDSTRLHFCLAHIHEVQGSLQIVEFFGVALLAEEMEELVKALLDRTLPDSMLSDAMIALQRALADMPRYLEKVREAQREFPSELILAINELRAVRSQPLLATGSVFLPDMAAGTRTDEAPLRLAEGEFLDVAKKLRQMYQVALLGYYRGHETRKNLNYMAKVCARAAKICRGHAVQDVWVVCIALLEGLLNNSIHSGFAVRSLLRRVDKEIRLFVEAGPAVLERPLPEALLRDMLFYVATCRGNSNYIRDVKQRYKTAAGLPALTGDQPDSGAKAIHEALSVECSLLANALKSGGYDDTNLQRLQNVQQAAAVLGLTEQFKTLRALTLRFDEAAAGGRGLDVDLRQLASTLGEVHEPVGERVLFNGSEEAQQQLDRAYLSVVRESRNGLELAKEAVVNFVANQWNTDYLKELPELLTSISGSLLLAELGRAADVLQSCRRFVSEQLLDDPHTPDWQTLDALADSLTAVDYYLERCASDFGGVDDDILSVAERCIEQLGYPTDMPAQLLDDDNDRTEVSSVQAAPAEPVTVAATSAAPTETSVEADDGDDAVDEELVEIFIEEADEVLDTINEHRPTLSTAPSDENALGEVRRGFHTLKGSGRMVNALQIGELAWSIENMLNRVVEGRFRLDAQRLDVIDQSLALLPSLIAGFKARRHDKVEEARAIAAQADALAEEASPDLSALQRDAGAQSEAQDAQTGDDSSAQVAAVPEPPGDETDDALSEIFVAEARIHLQVVENFLSRAEAPIELPDAMQRSLHTLKGAANMAEMVEVATVVSPLERFVKEMRALRAMADVDALMLLRDAVNAIGAAIDRIAAGEGVQVAKSDVLLGRIDSLHRRLLMNAQSAADAREEDRIAPGELDAFMVSTGDTLAAMAHTLEHYADAQSLHRLSETAGHISKRAESIRSLDAIAELAGALQIIMQDAVNPVPDEAVDLCRRATDSLDAMLNQLAAEQKPDINDALVAQLREFDYRTALNDVAQGWDADETADVEEIDITVPPEPTPEIATETFSEPEPENITLEASAVEDEEADPEVTAIFLEEADELLEGVDEAINAWSDSDGSQSDLNNLLRHLHTIKGGARMAGLTKLGAYTHEFESFVESAIASGESNSDQFLPRLHVFQDALVTGVEAIKRGETFSAETPAAVIEPPLLSEPIVLAEPPEETPALVEQQSDADSEVVEIFLEEADDLVEAIDDALQYWTGDRSNAEHLELLQRHLHTFKGGARLAGLSGLGDLCHEFEAYIEQTDRRDDDFLSQMLAYQDRINEGLTAVRSGNRKWVSEPLLPAVAAKSELSDAPQPGALVPTSGDAVERPASADSQMPQEMIKVSAQLMENLVNLAGETSISRGRAEEQVSELTASLDEMSMTVERLQEQVRRLDIETEAQILFRQEQVGSEQEGFDPLEFDRYSQLQQLSRSLMESSSDLIDIRQTLGERTRDMETLLIQQGRINTELQEGLMRSRMVHFTRMVPRLRRIVRQISLELGKRVEFKVYNAEGELDRTVLERIIPPLEHMLRNAVDHGIESAEARRAADKAPVGNISMRFGREGGDVLIVLSDDGAGIDFDAVRKKAIAMGLLEEGEQVSQERLADFLFEAGFSTASEVTQISGRGVGMDVVYSEIKQLGGSIAVDSTRGKGTRFTIRLPFTVSVNRALMVSIGGDIFAIPINTVEGVVRVSPYELEVYYQPDAPPFEYANQSYSLNYLGTLLRTSLSPHLEGQTEPRPVLLARGTDRPTAVQIDSILGSREIVVKALGPQFSHVHGLSGATVLGDGSVVVIVDIPALVRSELQRGRDLALEQSAQRIEQRNRLVMVVDDSVTVRKVTSRLLERQGFDVMLAKDGVDAVTQLQTCEQLPDVMLLDIEMPRMDGFEVASRVRHTSRLQDIPIIMITSRTGDKHRERAYNLGVNKYLGKPYQEITLLQAISEVSDEAVES